MHDSLMAQDIPAQNTHNEVFGAVRLENHLKWSENVGRECSRDSFALD